MLLYNKFTMEAIELYNLAKQNGIPIYHKRMKKRGAVLYCDGEYYIALSNKIIHSQRQQKEVLAEELAHCLTGTVYQFTWITSHVGQLNIAKAENKAQKTAAALLVPLERLKELSYLSVAEIAEELNLSEKTVLTAIEYYQLKGLL